MNLPLPPDIEARLRHEAAAAGVDLESFVAQILSDRLADSHSTTGPPSLATTAERLEFFRRFADRHPRRSQPADDSRETIYADRGR